MQEYKKLDKSMNEDIEKVREFAQAINELSLIQKRVAYLKDIISENKDLKNSIWTTAQGVALVIAEIPDDHLRNIAMHISKNKGWNNRVYFEFTKRFGNEEIPFCLGTGDNRYEDEDELFF